MINDLFLAQSGLISSEKFKRNEIARRSHLIELSMHQDVASVHTGGVNSLDIDKAENRYLLSGCSDGSIYIHDLYNFSGLPHFTARCICKVNKYSESAHKSSVECTTWYGQDNELFITSGTDQVLKVWDANSMRPVESFHCKGRIFYHDCTSVPTQNPILAVATSVKDVELIDLRTGNGIHELRGHSSSVLSCSWSPADEYMLATGGVDNKIFFWDIRSSSSFLKSLDQYNGNDSRGTAHFGYVNGLKFTSDGLLLLSAGTDNRLRLWETLHGSNLMINYGRVVNDMKRHLDFAICNLNSPIAFVPSEGFIYVLEMYTGNTRRVLHGHFNIVNCTYFRELNQELYTGSKDRNILMWTPDNSRLETFIAEDIKYEEKIITHFSSDSDNWTSD